MTRLLSAKTKAAFREKPRALFEEDADSIMKRPAGAGIDDKDAKSMKKRPAGSIVDSDEEPMKKRPAGAKSMKKRPAGAGIDDAGAKSMKKRPAAASTKAPEAATTSEEEWTGEITEEGYRWTGPGTLEANRILHEVAMETNRRIVLERAEAALAADKLVAAAKAMPLIKAAPKRCSKKQESPEVAKQRETASGYRRRTGVYWDFRSKGRKSS